MSRDDRHKGHPSAAPSPTARPGSGDFERDVHAVARLIPAGRVTSYGAIEGEPIDRDDVDDLADAGYDTIGGACNHLAAVRELVELPLKHPELWTKLRINTPRGVLLTGPSG